MFEFVGHRNHFTVDKSANSLDYLAVQRFIHLLKSPSNNVPPQHDG